MKRSLGLNRTLLTHVSEDMYERVCQDAHERHMSVGYYLRFMLYDRLGMTNPEATQVQIDHWGDLEGGF